MNIYAKWLLIVCLNAILGFYLGQDRDNYPLLAGMVTGVLVWYLIYLSLDLYLVKSGKSALSRRLTISACLRIPMQFILYVEFYAGFFALHTVQLLGFPHPLGKGFVEALLMTFFTGLYLSCVCALLFPLVSLLDHLRLKRKAASTKGNSTIE